MRKIAVVLARAGSKRLPHKNRLHICGKMLFEYSIDEAIKSEVFTHILVSTDDSKIAYRCKVKYSENVWLIKRPLYLANDTAPSEEAVLHATNGYNAEDWIMLLQPTSVLRKAEDIITAEKMRIEFNQSVVSVDAATGKYNGAIYYMSLDELLKKRKYNCDAVYEMPHNRSVDIDDEHDFKKAKEVLEGL